MSAKSADKAITALRHTHTSGYCIKYRTRSPFMCYNEVKTAADVVQVIRILIKYICVGFCTWYILIYNSDGFDMERI